MASVLWAMVVAVALPAGATFDADAPASTVRYTIVHKFHRVEGVTHDVEARAVVRDDGSVLVMVRVPVASFRSGDANRDEHMLEAVEAGKFPFVVARGVAHLSPSRDVPTEPLPVQAEVELHGVRTATTVPVALRVESDGSVAARGTFDVSLDGHGVERPSLLFVKIDDDCRIDFDVVLRTGR